MHPFIETLMLTLMLVVTLKSNYQVFMGIVAKLI